MKKEIKNISLSALFSALIVVLIMVGTFIELLDITVAAICSFAVYIVQIEAGRKYSLLVYITSCVLSLIFTPLSSATLYFIGFFGYYLIVKDKMQKMNKHIRKLLCIFLFNAAMCLLILLFKSVFALQNEPWQFYIILLLTLNIFFFCFDYILDLFVYIYFKKIRRNFKFFK